MGPTVWGVEETITADGLRLVVYEEGEPAGPTVLLVHGFPDTAEVWEPLVGQLKGRFRVVRYDVRGVGRSEGPHQTEGYRIERLADDLIRVVEATGNKRVHLVGHDWGAVQGWRAVAERPEVFESFTAISGPDLGHASDWYQRNFPSWDTAKQLARSWYMAAFKVPKAPDLFFPTNGLNLYRANIGREHEPRRIATRSLLIVPTKDRFVTPAFSGSANAWCEALTVKTVPAGHWVIKTHPEVVAAWIEEIARQG